MRLPDLIEVHVATPAGAPIERALVWLNTRVLGQDYFRPFIGLTAPDGIARITADALERDFAHNRAFWVMDYRVPLEECDDEVVIGLEGGDPFEEHRQAALGAAWVTEEAKEIWRRARNADFVSASRLVPIPPTRRYLRVDLEAASLRPSV